jgi:competence protein ComEC
MRLVGVLPAVAFVAGAATGIAWTSGPSLIPFVAACVAAAWLAFHRRSSFIAFSCVVAGFGAAGMALASHARDAALNTPLRAVLDVDPGGFSLHTVGAGVRHDPMRVRGVLLEDAAPGPDFTTVRARVEQIWRRGAWIPAAGAVTFTVGGRTPLASVETWRAGRTVETFATFRRPAVYLNQGVPDFERQLALDGTTVFGSVKSGLLVDIRKQGSVLDEAAADARAHVRRSVGAWVGPYDAVSAAVVTAVLIGDRSALPDDSRERLQKAGTYHVIAISGGNIAILAGLTLALLLVCGVTGRPAALVTILVLIAYAQIVTTGASVWRATVMAVVYLAARLLDHRTPPWQAMALAAVVILAAHPLDVRDAGFLLTFGAAAALIEGARRMATSRSGLGAWRWFLASLAASAAVELALLPVSAATFSRVTGAGLVLNLAAVPLMVVVQVSGMAVSLFDRLEGIAAPAGRVAHWATSALLESARLVDVAPWLSIRVPPPHVALIVCYYGSLAASLVARSRIRVATRVLFAASAAAIVTGQPASWLRAVGDPPHLRLIAFDVGQGDSTLLQFPDRSALLVDAGGVPFGSTAFDIGARVLAPALWSRGLRRLDGLVVTHGDPDHIGGAPAILDDFAPAALWQGIPVAAHASVNAVLDRAMTAGARIENRRLGDVRRFGDVDVRVLHPPAPDWERPRVRNDDSIVLDVRYGEVSILLMGDVGASVEREIIPLLRPASTRILKVGHHGSRTSTSQVFLDAVRPHIAIISCGRGNTFGHPAPEVLQRLEAIGADIYRTDRDGEITLESDGHYVRVRTFTGGRK